MSLISTHFYLPVYQTHSKLVHKPRWSILTYSYGASYSTNWGNVSEPLKNMPRVTGGDPLLFEARDNVLGAYQQLRDSHPAFPESLRDFQVIKSTIKSTACTLLPLQADIVAAAINAEDCHHILSSLPTGMGKTLPMIVASCLLPPGVLSFF